VKKKLAIIGSGIAGLSSAYFLQNDFDVTVFEKNDYLGGHANTRQVNDTQGKTISIDTGFIVYNELTYPNLTKLFDQLKVPIQHAVDSQGILHIFKNYCQKNQCISCNVGFHLMKL